PSAPHPPVTARTTAPATTIATLRHPERGGSHRSPQTNPRPPVTLARRQVEIITIDSIHDLRADRDEPTVATCAETLHPIQDLPNLVVQLLMLGRVVRADFP